MIFYGKQSINDQDLHAVKKVLKSKLLTTGPFVKKFEQILAKYFGAKFCSVVSNGTTALHLAGIILGWDRNTLIITTPITFVATANCVAYCNAKLDLVDINLNDYTLNIEKLEEKIIFYKKKFKKICVIGVDYAGFPCDWLKLYKLKKKYKIQLVNDNCHALGTRYNNLRNYACKYADIVTQSFHPVKNITTGEGGAILTNIEKFHNKIQYLRTHSIVRNPKKGVWFYEINHLGYNYRLSDIACSLGTSQLKRVEKFINKRNFIAKTYYEKLKDTPYIKLPTIKKYKIISYHLFPVLIDFKKLRKSKKKFFNFMRKNNILLQVHYIPIYMHFIYKKNFKKKIKEYKNSKEFYEKEVSLPIYYDLKKKEQLKVIRLIKRFISYEN